MPRPNRSSRPVPLPGPAIPSTPSWLSQSFSPSGPLPQAPAVTNQRPRPATTRYPILDNEFQAQQQYAELPTAPASQPGDKPDATIVADMVPTLAPAPAPTLLTAFTGIGATGWAPPDCALAAGPNDVLLVVNSSVALYNKAGNQQWQITLDQWFTNVVQQHKIFDPRALYDQYSDRWVLVAGALGPNNTQISLFLLSVSATNDPNGPWHNYALDATLDGTIKTNNWGDYPTLGVDDKALYITANMFVFNGNFAYAKIRIIDKTGPYAGNPVSFTDIPNLKDPNNVSAFTVQPCHTYGPNPQSQYFVSAVFPGSDELVLWTLTNPLATPPTIAAQTVPVSKYNVPPKAQQQGGGNTIDTGDTRLQNAVFRDGSVWTALTTRHNWGEPQNRAALHWFQIDPVDPTGPALLQEGVFGASGTHYYYPAVMPEAQHGLVVVFCRSSTTQFTGAHVSGRASGDPTGTLRPSAPLQVGLANYTNLQRWGDYAGIGLDPTAPDIVWTYTGFADANGNWSTAAGSVRV
jgi:hypothetical protein